jgi:hypothetical protein
LGARTCDGHSPQASAVVAGTLFERGHTSSVG